VVSAAPRKPWYRSRTLWFNVSAGVFASLEATTGFMRELLQVQAPTVFGAYAVIVAAANAALRVITTTALAWKPDAARPEPGPDA
jgi:hypothetical protein